MPVDLHREVFLLVLNSDGARLSATVRMFLTAEDRIAATKFEIFGGDEHDPKYTEEEEDQWKVIFSELQESGFATFEGDPSLQWIDADMDEHVIHWEYLMR